MHETVPLRCDCEGDEPVSFKVQEDADSGSQYLCRGCVFLILEEWLGDDGNLAEHWIFSIERLYTPAQLVSRASEMRVEAELPA